MVAPAKAGLSVPVLKVNPAKAALVDKAVLLTVKVYVLVVPSCAVTTVLTVLLPGLMVIAPDALPLDTAVPFTVTLAVASARVGVTVIVAVPIETPAA